MIVTLAPGDKLVIELKDTDGRFEVEYGERELTVKTDLPDSDGRGGIIYSERFAEEHEKQIKGKPEETVLVRSDEWPYVKRRGIGHNAPRIKPPKD